MQSVLYSKYFLETASEQDKEVLQQQLLQTTLISKIQGNKKYKQGRGFVQEVDLSNKKVIIKSFFRGGFFSRLIENKFLHLHFCKSTDCFKYRPFGELKILENLSAQGISVPKPLAAFVKTSCGSLLYQGAIATEKIEGVENFLLIIKEFKKSENPLLAQEIKRIAKAAGGISKKILSMGIFHVDLHLGNILIDYNNNIFVIDFDRAIYFKESQKKAVYKKTISRWFKSCKKYRVEEIAALSFVEGLNGL